MPHKNSNFAFIKDRNLRENIDIVFDHIVELVSLSESNQYNEVIKSSFCKTIIIYTASIIEALLLYILQQKKSEEEYAQSKKSFKIEKVLYKVDEKKRIVLGAEVEEKEKFSFKKINLGQINKLCKEKGFIKEELFKDIDSVRELRNRQHIGLLSEVDKDYTKKDLEFVFSVANKVKNLAMSQ